MEVCAKLNVKKSALLNWDSTKKLYITEELIEALNKLGYDIRLVKLKDESGVPTLRSYSIEEVVKLANEEGISFGKYVSKYLGK